MYLITGYSIKIKNIVVNNVTIHYSVLKPRPSDLRNVAWVRVGTTEFSKTSSSLTEFEHGFSILQHSGPSSSTVKVEEKIALIGDSGQGTSVEPCGMATETLSRYSSINIILSNRASI